MLYLVNVDQLRTRMGLGPAAINNGVLQSALTAAHLRVESELETVFGQEEVTDTFFLDNSIQGAQENGMWFLRLSRGFITGMPTVTRADAFNSSGTDVTAVDSVNLKFTTGPKSNAQNGTLQLDQSVSGYVSVTYTAGFPPTGAVAPDWLKDAIIGYAPLVMNFSQVIDRPSDLQTLTTLNVQHAMAVMAPYRRPIKGLFPL